MYTTTAGYDLLCNEAVWSLLGFELLLKGKCSFEIYLLGCTFVLGIVTSGTLFLKSVSVSICPMQIF
jgi:hypothetical protein